MLPVCEIAPRKERAGRGADRPCSRARLHYFTVCMEGGGKRGICKVERPRSGVEFGRLDGIFQASDLRESVGALDGA